tara:strand:+ start:2889 stop:3380 length:492 start_codon:yes stop_codon:yes gene_type:complete
MEKAKIRSVIGASTEKLISILVSKVRRVIKNMDITEAINYLTLTGYPLKEAVRLTFMSKWNKKNSKRLLTLPLFIHKIFFVKYDGDNMADVYSEYYVSTDKIKQKEFNLINNTMDDIYHLSMEDIMEVKNMTKITDSKLSYCLRDIYSYNKNEIVEIQTEQIL